MSLTEGCRGERHRSTNAYARSSGTPSSASASARIAGNGTGGTSSCSPSSSLVISGGSTSSRDDMNWPTLIIRPPRSTASTWKRCAMRWSRAARPRAESPGEPDPRQEQLEPPRLHHVPGREPQDPAVAGAHVSDVGHRVSLTPTCRRHAGQS